MEFRESFLDPDGVDMATRALKNPLADLGALFERTETHIDLRRGQKSRQSANSSSAVGPLFRARTRLLAPPKTWLANDRSFRDPNCIAEVLAAVQKTLR